MMARRRFKQWLAFGLALGALSATTAQAATRPDDRAGTLGVGTTAVQSSVIRPDDRAGPLGVGTAALQHSTIRPDDRAGTLGVGSQSVAANTSDVFSGNLVNHPAAVRPDDRGGIRGVGTGTAGIVTPAPDRSGSSWDTAALAVGSALGALAVALVGFALIRHRRSTAAALQS
jgi:hypothetical protein